MGTVQMTQYHYVTVTEQIIETINCLTLERPALGIVSKLRYESCPVRFLVCDMQTLPAVTVDNPMPSPTKTITFLAGLIMGFAVLWKIDTVQY